MKIQRACFYSKKKRSGQILRSAFCVLKPLILIGLGKSNLAFGRNNVDRHVFINDVDNLGSRVRHGNMFQIFRQKDCLQIGMLLKILDCARPAHDEKGSTQSIGFRGVIVNDSYGG